MKVLLLADDDPDFREVVRNWLNQQEGYCLIGEASNGEQAISMTLELQPDVVLMDVSMPHLNGIEATKVITKKIPETIVIGMSIHADQTYREAMFAAGASGYIIKENLAEDLITVLRAILPRLSATGNRG